MQALQSDDFLFDTGPYETRDDCFFSFSIDSFNLKQRPCGARTAAG
jgi:hypothetical protein